MAAFRKATVLSAFVLALAGQPVAAQPTGSWCAVINLGIGTVEERCGFSSFEVCRREAQVHGSSSFCRQNNWYAPYWGAAEPRASARTKRRHRRH